MTENEWWSRYIKPRWHNVAIGWVARKVQDVTNKGAPDVDACWNGNVYKVELKYAAKAPTRPDTMLTFSRYSRDEPNRRTIVSREQERNLEEWNKAGGNAYLLIGIGKAWYFIDYGVLERHIGWNDGITIGQLAAWAESQSNDIKHVDTVPITCEPQAPEMDDA